ncbi:hypothetical protein NDU88_008404 [Pleurodeles waltl]|uniref:Uncharacterized protein n=1 Tax=Pleurodeles waltl TaxID=8319 RepID=A0AAV7SV26_PLEWA|nr:hypothetical protein NDU88_008404 [Pleurodeles waltl]
MSPWRAGLISPHWFSSASPPRSLSKAGQRAPLCPEPRQGTAPSRHHIQRSAPFEGLQVRLLKGSSAGVVPSGSQVTRPPFSTGALRLTDLVPWRQGEEVPPGAAYPTGHTGAPLTPQALQSPGAGSRGDLQLLRGPG